MGVQSCSLHKHVPNVLNYLQIYFGGYTESIQHTAAVFNYMAI